MRRAPSEAELVRIQTGSVRLEGDLQIPERSVGGTAVRGDRSTSQLSNDSL